MQITILEHASTYYPKSSRIKAWLVKIYSKLGLVSLVQNLHDSFEHQSELNQQRLSA